ncbi:MAG: phosphoadenylyl-sulfate reductase [Chloroflexota bacterium]
MIEQKYGEQLAERLDAANERLDSRSPQEILAWAFQEYAPDITLACSFGGITGMVLLDMAAKIYPQVRVFYLDTDFLFPETYELVREVSRRYGIQPVAFKSRLTPDAQASQYGAALWQRDTDLCCQLRKVEPNLRALAGQKAWISGLRRDQANTRTQVRVVEWDTKFNLAKVNPLAYWNEEQVWQYIRDNSVPYNKLHDKGYPSIGCTYCTRAVKPGEDSRAGRWAGSDKTECGLHTPGQATLGFDIKPGEGVKGDNDTNAG